MAVNAFDIRVRPVRRWMRGRTSRAPKALGIQFRISVSVLVFMVFLCFVGPHFLNIPAPNATNFDAIRLSIFSRGHLLGTDELGRDILSRVLWGGQVSFEVGFGAVALGLLIGTALGTIAAYVGGVVDVVIMRFIDMLFAFPGLILALAIAAYLGPSERNEIIAIAFFGITDYARYTRAATLKLREQDFLHSSAAIGSGNTRIIVRHVLPNIVGTVTTYVFLSVSGAIVLESALSYLGAGIRPPAPSWGNMIAEGQAYFGISNQMIFCPALFLCITVLSLNLLGDAVRARTQSH